MKFGSQNGYSFENNQIDSLVFFNYIEIRDYIKSQINKKHEDLTPDAFVYEAHDFNNKYYRNAELYLFEFL